MSNINGELLALYEAERLREHEACIATIRRVWQEVNRMSFKDRPNEAELIDLLIERIRGQP